jgi:hypothetical protein
MEPVVAFFWLMVGAIAVTATVFRYLRERSRLALLRTIVEKGQPMPANLFQESPRAWDHRAFVVAGILLGGISVAMALIGITIRSGLLHGVYTEKDNLVLILSLFPFCLGAACMVAGRYLRSHG